MMLKLNVYLLNLLYKEFQIQIFLQSNNFADHTGIFSRAYRKISRLFKNRRSQFVPGKLNHFPHSNTKHTNLETNARPSPTPRHPRSPPLSDSPPAIFNQTRDVRNGVISGSRGYLLLVRRRPLLIGRRFDIVSDHTLFDCRRALCLDGQSHQRLTIAFVRVIAAISPLHQPGWNPRRGGHRLICHGHSVSRGGAVGGFCFSRRSPSVGRVLFAGKKAILEYGRSMRVAEKILLG